MKYEKHDLENQPWYEQEYLAMRALAKQKSERLKSRETDKRPLNDFLPEIPDPLIVDDIPSKEQA